MTKPLHGWRVLVPRPADRAGELVGLLAAAGAIPEVVELIGIEPPEDPGPLDLAVLSLSRGEYAWVVFTSVNAVDAVLRRARSLAVPPVSADIRVAAVGPATAGALRSAGVAVDLVPPARGSATALAEAFPHAVGDQSVLLPRSDLAPHRLPDALTDMGYRVDRVVAYRTVIRRPPNDVVDRLTAGDFAAVLLTSPSTVQALAGVPIPPTTHFGAIGTPTRRAASRGGREIAFVAAEPTARSLVAALVMYAREA